MFRTSATIRAKRTVTERARVGLLVVGAGDIRQVGTDRRGEQDRRCIEHQMVLGRQSQPDIGAVPRDQLRKASIRPCHCLLRQFLQIDQRSVCIMFASSMASPAGVLLSVANRTRAFSLKCQNSQTAGIAVGPKPDRPYQNAAASRIIRRAPERPGRTRSRRHRAGLNVRSGDSVTRHPKTSLGRFLPLSCGANDNLSLTVSVRLRTQTLLFRRQNTFIELHSARLLPCSKHNQIRIAKLNNGYYTNDPKTVFQNC